MLALREGVVAELVKLVDDEPPAAMVEADVQRRVEDLAHRLQHQGATVQQWLDATGQTAEDVISGLRAQAVDAVKADLAIRAVVEAEGIEADDEAVEAEIARLATRMGEDVEKVRTELERAGQIEAVRSDVTRGKALEWLAEQAEVVDADGNAIDRSLLEPPAQSAEETSE